MRAYNVEFFDPKTFRLVYYTNVDIVEFTEDYLNPTILELVIDLADPTIVSTGQYIRIKRGDHEYFGVVTGSSVLNKKQITIKYTSFLGRFNQEILFDTNMQNNTSVELQMGRIISANWIETSDASEKVNGLTLVITSYTAPWTFNIKTDVKDSHYAKINSFLKTFILKSMEKYGICFDISLDVDAKSIVMTIGKNRNRTQYIEADLPNIIRKDITIEQNEEDVNKLIVYDSALGESMTSHPITYYAHPDGGYNTSNIYRITPVKRQIEIVTSSDEESFGSLAEASAADILGTIEHNNYIEIEVLPDDELVKPREMKFGQEVYIISNKTRYTSILTGKRITESSITLIFGTIRLDLTKKL